MRSEKVRTELQVQQAPEQYQLLFDGNPHPMWVLDEQTLGFMAVNEAAVQHYGYSRGEFLGMSVKDVVLPEDAEPFGRSIRREHGAAAARRSVGAFKHRRRDGGVIQMEVATSRIPFRGRPALLVVAMDVTDKRNLEMQLLQAQKMESVGRLAGGIAHDFNNLLGVISGYSELLAKELRSDDRLRRYVDDIFKASQRAAGLTRQLLAFSRRQLLLPRVLDLNVVVIEVEKMLRRMIGEDIEFTTHLLPDLPPIKADAGQLEQVLMNLVVNARDAMPRGGRLMIETGVTTIDERYAAQHAEVTPGRYAVLAISDTGHGMSPEVKARIFEPFFTTKELGKGTGLGLATVHGIVRQSGGHIFVYSEAGHGSTFKIYLPIVEEAAPEGAVPAAVELPRGAETILVVEDEHSLRSLIQECLEASGYTVLPAAHAPSAIELGRQHRGPIPLLISDVILPGMGGSELARQLAGERPGIKVLYISGYTDDALTVHDVRTLNMPFLEKPFTGSDLVRKVREVLDRT